MLSFSQFSFRRLHVEVRCTSRPIFRDCASPAGNGLHYGSVTDSSGAVIAGATVTVVNVATNNTITTQTNQAGFYSTPSVSIGDYTVSVESKGFKRILRSGIKLQVDERAQVDFRLELGAVAETVEVVGDASLVDTCSAQSGRWSRIAGLWISR